MDVVTKIKALQVTVQRVLDGKPPAREDAGKCVYNPAVNGGCAIGQFLGEMYKPEMDGLLDTNVKQLFRVFPEVRERFEDPDSEFWTVLQRLHDDSTTMPYPGRPGDLFVQVSPDAQLRLINAAVQAL